MDILFSTTRLRRLCAEQLTAQRKLGEPQARKLRARLADLAAADAVTDLVAGGPHPLKGERVGQFSVALNKGHRLVFKAANDPLPKTRDGVTDWSKVSKVRVMFIGDYHE